MPPPTITRSCSRAVSAPRSRLTRSPPRPSGHVSIAARGYGNRRGLARSGRGRALPRRKGPVASRGGGLLSRSTRRGLQLDFDDPLGFPLGSTEKTSCSIFAKLRLTDSVGRSPPEEPPGDTLVMITSLI